MSLKNKMNIAIFRDGPFLPPLTGGAVSIYNLIIELQRRGINVFLIKCYRKNDNYHLYLKEKFPTLFLKEENYYINIEPIINFLKENKIQIIHFDSAEAVNWQGNLIKCFIPKIKIVWEVMNVNHILFSRLKQKNTKIKLAIKQEKEALISADLVLARSEVDKRALITVGDNENKVNTYKGGIKISKQTKRSFPHGNKNIIFIGNLSYPPNREAVKIIDKIAIQIPDYNFQIVGNTDKKLIYLINAPNIKFLGLTENPYKLYNKALIGIVPLISGSGTRIKILEYLNAGLPVVTTNVGVEGLDKKIKKVLIAEDDFRKYPNIIKELAQNSILWLGLSKRGQCFVKKMYDWSKNINSIVKVYQKLYNYIHEKKSYKTTI